jgi:DNA-directed RNA polymerase sigma subunit (sigma70/sigma32)
MTLDQIGSELDVLRQRVSKKFREVLTRLRNNKQLKKIKQEWEDL